MRRLIVILFFLASPYLWSQKGLVNTFSYYSEVYGGMEDSGISRSESYVFVTRSKVELQEITYNGAKIQLKKGDTLIVNVHSFIPYNHTRVDSTRTGDMIKEPAIKDRFRVIKDGQIFYANVQWPYVWPGTIEYTRKKKSLVAVIKEGFDTGYTGYAP